MLMWRLREEPGESVTVLLSGDLTGEAWTAPLLRFLEDHHLNDGVREVLVDLSDVRKLDLEGIGTLLTLWKESHRRDKLFRALGSQGAPRARLAITGVLKVLEEGVRPGGSPS